MPANLESRHQRNLFRWAAMNRRRFPELELLHAIPNGAHVSDKHRIKLVAEGLRKGIPDIHLPVSKKGYHSLYLELKTEKGRISTHQKYIIGLLTEQGNYCKISRSLYESIYLIETYLT